MYSTSLRAQRDFKLKIQLVFFEVVMALNKATGVATMPAPIDLNDADSMEQTAVTKADAPHAEPGL